ncbi:DMT family transporter [Paludibacterium purpuratum]|uniref:EamA-like transporter family protein n=1 Tax=Paludibacterium purpuratum TaxID=1144873 RepID=A0A4R7BG50_9NEIS|nr:DMT family transporter [Paludibacterium purpuratum]TDR82737.1 EamA-like transporter family protein [Paludibacterium purpuratum]
MRGKGGSAALLVGLWLVWAYSWIASKMGLPYMTPLQLAFWRTLLGVTTLGVVILLTGRSLRPTPFWPTFWLGMSQTAAFGSLTTMALLAGGAGKVSVLAYTMPFWTLLLARCFLNERLGGLQWGAVVLACVGLVLIIQPWQLHGGPLSDVLAIAGGLAWAVGAVQAKRLRLRYRVSTMALTFWQMLWGVMPLGVLAWLMPAPPVHVGWQLVAILLYLGVFASGLGWLTWMLLLSRLSAGMASLNVLAIPAVAVLMAWLQMGEAPDRVEGVGMLLIALALALLSGWTVWRERQTVA